MADLIKQKSFSAEFSGKNMSEERPGDLSEVAESSLQPPAAPKAPVTPPPTYPPSPLVSHERWKLR